MTAVIGLISGTSVDGIDAALVEISGTDVNLQVELLAGITYPYPAALREQILAVCAGAALSMAQLAQLDDAIAHTFAQAALAVQAAHSPAQWIGSHGQTVYHRPPFKGERESGRAGEWESGRVGERESGRAGERESGRAGEWESGRAGEREMERITSYPLPTTHYPLPTTHYPLPTTHYPSPLGYSLQLGRGEVIAQLTGIPTVSNFRVADIAVGGQGAPLVSKIDAYLLSHPEKTGCVQNIGGIGNLTYLPARNRTHWDSEIRGWDTGPGNALLDLAVQHFSNGTKTYDQDGAWASTGTPCDALVEQWLQHEFFHQPPPKSTGRELFGVDFFQQCLADAEPYQLSAADMLATLTELTVASIVQSYRTFLPQMPDRVLLCGGGSRNLYLKQRLQAHLSPAGMGNSFPSSVPVLTTDEVGLSADYKEAIAFAVLAYWRQRGIPGNLPQVTGAQQDVLLGDIHLVPEALHGSI